jgi:ubiquinone/menaquinone biosynthesis C-methylase UbiE
LKHKSRTAPAEVVSISNVDSVLQNLSLTPSTVFADLGCGSGNYTIAIAQAVGPNGVVYAVDVWEDGLNELRRSAALIGLANIVTVHANINEHIPLDEGTVDTCFMATVLHDLLRDSTGEVAMGELLRVLKPGGRLAVIEFKKVENGPGPLLSVRISPEQIREIVKPFGFVEQRVIEVGPFNYLFIGSLADH